jgi:hypothetical protein
MITIRTIRQGDRIAVWDVDGRVEYVDGPRWLMLWGKTIQRVPHFRAAADQYLAVTYTDGHVEHLRGPAAIWQDLVAHANIEVKQALPLDSHEAIVVYRRDNGQVSRRVVRGPALFMPTENEWLHAFRWHGADPKHPHHKIPRGLQFTKLRVIPDQTYHHVEDVRTADDALLTVKLMIFFELADIETMLDQTHDPVADFINAVTADIIAFVGARNFETFKLETEQLNELAAYPNLVQRAARIGYRINKVVYRGYMASPALQAMHDGAIEARTKLKLEAETENQSQDLADLKLTREAVRAEQRRGIEADHAAHAVRLKRLAHDDLLRRREAEHKARLEARRQRNELALQHERNTDEERTRFLATLREMQVDMTRYLVAQYQHPDRLIRISGENGAQLHLHE